LHRSISRGDFGKAGRMAKNIVICSDGTGNTAIKGRGTNVFKLFEAVDLNGHRTNAHLRPQIAFYDDGVGTENFKPLRLLGGAAGAGLGRNVRQLYSQLSRVYDPGDRIYLFGFSRGAFTVRTLAGMINACGLVDGTRIETSKRLRRAVRDTYCAYRAGYDSLLTRVCRTLARRPGRATAIDALRTTYEVHYPVPIAFVGVWDTVDAVGLPLGVSSFVNRVIYQFKFPTHSLGKCVEYACHALSIDEPRVAFQPVLWDETPDLPIPASLRSSRSGGDGGGRRLDQVWFAGVHSNIGGGYPKQGMSLVALDWMLHKAQARGLRLNEQDLKLYTGHASVDDKMYDPRAGFGLFYRWSPRDITKLCAARQVAPQIHLTVAERLAHGTDEYALGNLPANTRIVFTETGDAAADDVGRLRAEKVEDVIRRAHLGRRHLLAEVKGAVTIGEVSYWLFIAAWVVLLVAAIGAATEPGRPTLAAIASGAWHVATSLLTLHFGDVWPTMRTIWTSWWRMTVFAALGTFCCAWLLSRIADNRMSDAFSSFWHKPRQELRTALKCARKEAEAMPAPPDITFAARLQSDRSELHARMGSG
jgi:uncharacterized protein (DUF2235 family)